MTTFKKSIGCLLAAGAAYGAWWMGMNYTGYCHAERKYLSDTGIIENILSNNSREIAFYKNIECCSVIRGKLSTKNILDKIFGRGYFEASMKMDSEDLARPTKKTMYFSLDNCGNTLFTYSEQI